MLWVWTLGLLVAAILLAVLELFVPSGGFLAFLTLVALVASVACALSTQSSAGFLYFLALLIGGPVVVRWLIRWFPQSPMGRRLLLHPESDPALVPSEQQIRLKRLLGRRGVAVSRMMPGGVVDVLGDRIDAVSDSGPIDAGTEVIVVRLDGMRVVVRLLPAMAMTTGTAAPTSTTQPTVDDPFA